MNWRSFRHPWEHMLVCLFWVGSTIMALLTFLGGNPNTPVLASLSMFNIQAHDGSLFAGDKFTVGVYGVCTYSGNPEHYNLKHCSTHDRAPFYFKLEDVMIKPGSDAGYSAFKNYEPTLQNMMMTVWVLLVVFIGMNVCGLILCIVGIKWSSVCRELAINLGVLNLVVNITYSAVATAYAKRAISAFNKNPSGAANAGLQVGGIVLVWVLFVFCYFLYAFITVIVKHKNRDLEQFERSKNMHYDLDWSNDSGNVSEIASTPVTKQNAFVHCSPQSIATSGTPTTSLPSEKRNPRTRLHPTRVYSDPSTHRSYSPHSHQSRHFSAASTVKQTLPLQPQQHYFVCPQPQASRALRGQDVVPINLATARAMSRQPK